MQSARTWKLPAGAGRLLFALAILCCLMGSNAVPTTTTTAAEAENPDLRAVLKIAASAPALPKPEGKVVRVADSQQLISAVRAAAPGTTILLADGKYVLDRLRIRQDRLTIRGESGDREKIILDGADTFSQIIRIRRADDLLIADLTVANCRQYGIFFLGDSDVQRLRIYNVKFHNIWTRGLKGTHPARIRDSGRRLHPPEIVQKVRPRGGEVRYCLFVNDRVKPYHDSFGGDYVGGMDLMWLKDWVIADNVFVGIRGRRGGGRGAIFVWVNSENVVSERNVFVNCDRSICYGNPSGAPLHMTNGIIRNNFVVAGRRQGIEIIRTRSTKAYNNTVVTADPGRLGVIFFQGAEGGEFFNNLVCGRVRLPEEVKHGNNLLGPLEGYFVNPAIGDLHLTAKAVGAIGKGRPLKEVAEDFDRRKRKDPPDIGADEFTAPQERPQAEPPPGQ
jgi:hypothetical protein